MRFLTLRLYRTTIAYSQSIKIQSFYGNFFYFTMYLHEVWHGLLSIALVYCPWCNLRRNYSKLTTIAYSCLTTLIIKLSYGKCIKCEGATVNFITFLAFLYLRKLIGADGLLTVCRKRKHFKLNFEL